ncbi:growth/differentiatio [Mustelus asterias]
MEKTAWQRQIPTRPDAKYLKYMKRLYTKSATQDGIPKRPADRRYNTEWPINAGRPPSCRVFEQDVFYGLDPVTAGEELLRSVLLYSVDNKSSFPQLCSCNLTVQERSPLSGQTCSSPLRSYSFGIRLEGRKRQKWVEVELASFLSPFLGPRRGALHIVFTYRCVRGARRRGGNRSRALRPGGALRAPSLLLFLNDTREQVGQSWLPSQPGVQLPGRKGKAARRRRAPERELPQLRFPDPDQECQLYDFHLSFSQLSWDRWIIAPHQYNPHYCKGGCPRALSHRYGSPVHTLIQNILYEKVDSSVPRPSCVPSKYNPLSVLTLENDGSIVYKEYEDMVATTCTCR